MATFDQLQAEQRAIVELVLRQGKTYAELSDMLNMPKERVRELARDALVDLAPVSVRGVEEDWRGQLADYVLGQQSGPEATATRGHLRRSEAARSWTRSLLDSLDQLYGNGLPEIPEGDRGRAARRPREAAARAATDGADDRGAATLSPAAQAVVRRRRLLAAGGIAALLLVALLLWPIGLLTGDDDEPSSASAGDNASSATNADARGQAAIVRQNGKVQIILTATKLEPTGTKNAYQLWLYNNQDDLRSLGATVTDNQGNLQAGAQLPAGYEKYKFLDLSREPLNGDNKHSGETALRGVLKLREKPVTRGQGKQRITLLAEVQMVPLPK
jgi:Anti-sigma-K factor rskA/Sigma-70, region 4